MTIEAHTCEVEDLTFEITPMPLKKARKVSLQLARALGPAAAAALMRANSLGELRSASPRLLGSAIMELLEHLDDSMVDGLFKAFGDHCTWIREDGRRPLFQEAQQEEAFRGRVLLSFQWLKACTEVNFADFFDGLTALIGKGPQEDPLASHGKT